MNSYAVICTCELQLDIDKLKVEEVNTLSFKVCIDALMVHCQKKQADLTVQCTNSKDDIPCTVSVHSCRPSAVYHALCSLMPSISCLTCTVSSLMPSISCLPCIVFTHAVHQLSNMHCLFTHAIHQLSTMHCVHSCRPSFIHSFIMHSVNPYKVNQPIGYRTCHNTSVL